MDSGCVEWQGARSSNGYGTLTIKNRQFSAHRWAWEQAHGPIPPGMHVCHHCDNRACINPEHLFVGTHQDNMDDARRKGRSLAKLNEEQVLAIRASTDTQKVLAERYGVSLSAIRGVRRRMWWNHVDGPPIRYANSRRRPMKGSIMKNRSLQLDDEVNDGLVAAAKERGVSVNWLINQLCREGLARLVEDIRVTT